jgi:uncharacterized protein
MSGFSNFRTVATNPAVQDLIEGMSLRMKHVSGVVLATRDGFAVADTLTASDPHSAAALFAALAGLTERIAMNIGPAPVDEVTIRTAAGTIAAYRVGQTHTLAVMAYPEVTLGLLHFHIRDLLKELAPLLETRKASATDEILSAELGSRIFPSPSRSVGGSLHV